MALVVTNPDQDYQADLSQEEETSLLDSINPLDGEEGDEQYDARQSNELKEFVNEYADESKDLTAEYKDSIDDIMGQSEHISNANAEESTGISIKLLMNTQNYYIR